MPRYVDPEARRRDVIDALFRIVVRDGLQHASLRNVATEANLNIGSLRHYFETQQQLMLFAMRSMVDRVSERLLRRVGEAAGVDTYTTEQRRDLAIDLIGELLPLDEKRRVEVILYLEFLAAARTNPALADLAAEVATGTQWLMKRILNRMIDAGDLGADSDPNAEALRLWALVDGLAFNAIIHPGLVTKADCLAALRAHFDSLGARHD